MSPMFFLFVYHWRIQWRVCVSVCVCVCLCVFVCVGVVTGMIYLSAEDEEMVTDSPHAGSLLSSSSKTLPATAPGMVSTSGYASISSRGPSAGRRGTSGHQLGPMASGHWVDMLSSWNSWRHIIVSNVKTHVLHSFLSHTLSLMLNHKPAQTTGTNNNL